MKNMIHLAVMTLLVCFFATSVHAAQISVEPAYQEVFHGDNFTVDIAVYPEGSEVYGASYTLNFNNTLLNATLQTQGPFLRQDGKSSNIFRNVINNTLGTIEYAESRMGVDYGVSDPGILATITFTAIGEEGISPLTLTDLDGQLLYSTSGPISTVINHGSVEIIETPQFTISGFVEYDNSDPVLGPNVIITNLNTSQVLVAETTGSSNYYQASTELINISTDDVLHFDVSDDLSNVTEFDHTVTQDEIDTGSFVENITIYIPDTTPPVITNVSIISVTKHSATITWETDEPADSLVKYGIEPGNYNQTVHNATDEIFHIIDLVGLASNTTYYFVVNSTDPSNNCAQSIESDFTTFTEIIIEISDVVALPGVNVTTPIMIRSAPNVGTVDIILTYNQSIVNVTAVLESDFDFMDAAIDNSNGNTRFIAFQLTSPGLSGNVKIANVTLTAVGSGGQSSDLNISIIELKDAGPYEIPIPAVEHNGTFAVMETTPPLVINPTANPSSIPEDTDFNPGWGETSQLNVTVIDESDVDFVTVNLSSIGGMPDMPMTHISGTDIWTVTVNASIGSAMYNESYLSHYLAVSAVDTLGNVNMSVTIPLTVILNGDVSENGEVTLYDAMYIAKHILNRPDFEIMNDAIADVSGNGAVTSYDGMYLGKHISTEAGFELLH